MKKYIRDMIDDLQRAKTKAPTAPLPNDLANQELSQDPEERVRQLDYQAQKDEERERS